MKQCLALCLLLFYKESHSRSFSIASKLIVVPQHNLGDGMKKKKKIRLRIRELLLKRKLHEEGISGPAIYMQVKPRRRERPKKGQEKAKLSGKSSLGKRRQMRSSCFTFLLLGRCDAMRCRGGMRSTYTKNAEQLKTLSQNGIK